MVAARAATSCRRFVIPADEVRRRRAASRERIDNVSERRFQECQLRSAASQWVPRSLIVLDYAA
jgi:hypothetical protein